MYFETDRGAIQASIPVTPKITGAVLISMYVNQYIATSQSGRKFGQTPLYH